MRNRQAKWKPYRSGLEFAFAADMKRKGIEFRYEPQTLQYRKRITKGVCDTCHGNSVSQRRTYLPDFVVRAGKRDDDERTDRSIYIETKGRLTSADRAKMVAVKQDNPELDIRFIFGSNNKINKNSDTRYSDWADKHGFPYAIGASYPDAWLQLSSGLSIDSDKRPVRRQARKGSKG